MFLVILQVRPSNERCLKFGGDNCLLNYEAMKSHTIRVRVTDSGTPPESAEFSIAISVMKENDRPRNLQISNQEVCLSRYNVYFCTVCNPSSSVGQ